VTQERAGHPARALVRHAGEEVNDAEDDSQRGTPFVLVQAKRLALA
jgi:hypothetical protein